MRKMLTGMAVLAALAVASSSHAAPGTIAMSWTGCNVPVVTDLTVADGSTNAKLFCYVTGMSDPTKSYQLQLLYGDANKTVPDAWRFDPVGCQGSSFVIINHLAPSSVVKTCATFQGPVASVQVKDVGFSPVANPYPTTLMRISLADLYGDTPNAPSAGTKYFVMDTEFDETFGTAAPTAGSNCGGLGAKLCFNLNSATYIIADGSDAELPFVFHGGADGDWATANGGGTGGCQNTPVVAKTWGSIKSQYHN